MWGRKFLRRETSVISIRWVCVLYAGKCYTENKYTLFKQLASRLRHRIETAFSVLVKVFNIEHPGSRSLTGLIARTATRILAYTLCFITGPLLARLGP